MKRAYFILGDTGQRRLAEADFPLTIGGLVCDIQLPGLAGDRIVAHIALSDGHAYVQPANEQIELFHNHEYLASSAWLKSGDRIQFEHHLVCWDIKGDQVFIKLECIDVETELTPPSAPPPGNEAQPQNTALNGSDTASGNRSELAPKDQLGQGDDFEEIIPIGAAPISSAKRRRIRYLLIALFSVLCLAALFVVFATPMSVNISPKPDKREVSGFPPPVSFGKKKLVVPGTYTVNATRTGYYPLEQSFEVTSNGFQAFDFELKELPGRIKIRVNPDVPVRVSVKDTLLAVEEGNIVSVGRGVQLLSIATDRYIEEQREVDVAGFGELQELVIVLQPAWANVRIESDPPAARVMVDGRAVGKTPLDTEIIMGKRELGLRLTGHKPVRFEQDFTAGSTVVLDTISLEPNDGRLELKSRPAGAIVSIDGKFHGTTPVNVVLKSGVSHQLTLSRPGYLTVSKTIVVKPDDEQALSLELPPEFGIVFASARPADADLAVDGKPAGKGTQRLRLTTRPHELTFSKAGYASQTVKLTPSSETSQNIDVVLKTLQQVKEESRPQLLITATGQEMPLIEPQGSFEMGASRREAGRRANESQRLVELTRAYYLSRKEVTNGEYRKFKKNHTSGSAEGTSLNGDLVPVVNVSWDDAARYCNWLSEQDNLPPFYIEQDGHMFPAPETTIGYRLPSEAEWVYAARVFNRVSKARYPWGDGYPPANKAGNYADAQIADTLANVVTGYNDGYRGLAPVGSFESMPTGFYDFGGNAAEWVNDLYAVYPGQAQRLVKDPKGPASGDHHVVRGSSWRDGSITDLRLSYRDYSRGPRDDLGFRIARYANE